MPHEPHQDGGSDLFRPSRGESPTVVVGAPAGRFPSPSTYTPAFLAMRLSSPGAVQLQPDRENSPAAVLLGSPQEHFRELGRGGDNLGSSGTSAPRPGTSRRDGSPVGSPPKPRRKSPQQIEALRQPQPAGPQGIKNRLNGSTLPSGMTCGAASNILFVFLQAERPALYFRPPLGIRNFGTL